jgi:hypothetical protein
MAQRALPELEHPLGGIQIRVLSAYFAGLLWQAFFKGDRLKNHPAFIPA